MERLKQSSFSLPAAQSANPIITAQLVHGLHADAMGDSLMTAIAQVINYLRSGCNTVQLLIADCANDEEKQAICNLARSQISTMSLHNENLSLDLGIQSIKSYAGQVLVFKRTENEHNQSGTQQN